MVSTDIAFFFILYNAGYPGTGVDFRCGVLFVLRFRNKLGFARYGVELVWWGRDGAGSQICDLFSILLIILA